MCYRREVPVAPESKEEPFGNMPVFSDFLCQILPSLNAIMGTNKMA